MRRINGKRFLILLVGLAFFGGGVFAVHAVQYGRIGKSLLYQARKAEEKGQASAAAKYRQRYLEFNPRDLEEKANLARTWTGESYPIGSKARTDAVRVLDEILLHNDDAELRLLLVRTAVEQGIYKPARDHLSKLLPFKNVEEWIGQENACRAKGTPLPEIMAKEDKARGELEFAWGRILEAEKADAAAIGAYRLAVRHAPENVTAAVQLAYMLRKAKEADPAKVADNAKEADAVIDRLVAKGGDDYASHLARWRYRRDFDLIAVRENGTKGKLDLDACAEDVAQALKRKPESLDVLLAAADLERLRGRVVMDSTSIKSPEARREKMKEHRAKAADHLRKGLDVAAKVRLAANAYNEFQLLWHKGNLLLDDMDLEATRREQENLPDGDDRAVKAEIAGVIEMVRKTQMPAAADYMQGRLLIHDRKWSDAVTLFERARTQLAAQPDLACQANLYLGKCYERLEDHTLMHAAFQRVIEYDPTSTAALMGMAAARWGQGQLDNALAQYDSVMKQEKVPPRGWIDIARLEMQRQAAATTPNFTDVETCLKNAETFFPDGNLEIVLLRAELALRKNQPDEAEKTLTAAAEKFPKEPEYRTALIDLALQRKQNSKATERMNAAREELADHVSIRLARARVLSVIGGKESAKEIKALADKRDGFTEREQGRLLGGIAEALFRLDARADAKAMWQALAALPRHKNDLRLRQLLFDLAVREGSVADMKAALTDIETIEQGSGVYHRYGTALMQIWQAKKATSEAERVSLLKQARQQLDSVSRRRGAWSALHVARAEVAELNGNPEQAAKDLQEAMRLGDNSLSTVRRLASLLSSRGRDDEAKALLDRVKSSDADRLAAVLALRRGETDAAVAMARKAVDENASDPKDLLWMARILASAGKMPEAEAKLREAVKASPADPQAWVAMVQLLATAKRNDDAKKVIAEAATKIAPTKRDAAMGRMYDHVGMRAEALAAFKAAADKGDAAELRNVAAAHLGMNRVKEAEGVLRALVKAEKPTADDLAWGKRTLAMILAAGTDYTRFVEALALVGLSLDESGKLAEDAPDENTENRRAKARVLSSQNQQQFRRKAISLFEELDRLKALTADDAFVLAVMYEKEGDARKSRERLNALAASPNCAPQALAQLALGMLGRKPTEAQMDEVEKLAARLEAAEKKAGNGPNGFASVEIRGRLLEARGKGDEAIALLKAHVTREGAKPEEVILLLASLGRQKKYAAAFELCEKTWDEGKCMPEAVGSVSVGLLRVMSPSDAQIAKVEERLSAAMKKKPDSVVLIMHLADLYDRRGKYDQAAELYRSVLAKEPNNVVALNNLAWLLAHRTGEATAALDHINRAVNGIGRRPDLLDTRGVVHLALKDTTKALADLDEASREAPTPTRLLHLARALHEDKNPSKAREALRQAKDKGLQVGTLHPVEQDAAKKLLQEYGFR